MRNSLLVLVVALLLAANVRAQSVDALPTLGGQEAIEQLQVLSINDEQNDVNFTAFPESKFR